MEDLYELNSKCHCMFISAIFVQLICYNCILPFHYVLLCSISHCAQYKHRFGDIKLKLRKSEVRMKVREGKLEGAAEEEVQKCDKERKKKSRMSWKWNQREETQQM